MAAFYSCTKYSDTTPPSNDLPAEQMVNASLQGRVLDENGQPVQGAAVVSGTAATATNVDGVFSFSNISMSSRFGFVTVTKPGYFTGSRSIITNASSSSYVSIQLVPRVSKGSFAAASGGTILVTTGDTAGFPATAVIDAATKAAYTGQVTIYATYLDPTVSDVYKYMPGDQRGIGTNGKETALQSFGMMQVQMEGDAGEKLQLAAGKKATLTWAIPAVLQATAPVTIPLWYFNDSSGRWIEEGSAIRVGNSYVGQVGHFTYWSCALPVSTVNYKVRLKDQNGNPLAYTYVYFKSQSYYGPLGVYTDSAGFAQGLIPTGVSLVMQVVSQCGNVLAGANVGPALADQDLGTITVTINYAELTISGKVVNCTNAPIDSGYVNATIDGLNYRATIKNGAFSLPVSRCFNNSTSIDLSAYDFVALKQSSVSTIKATNGDVDAGTLTICDAPVGQFFTFAYNGASRTFTNPPDSVTYSYYQPLDEISIVANNVQNGTPVNGTVQFYLQGVTGTGNYPIYDFQYTDATGKTMEGVGATCTITTYDPVGGYFAGTLSGNLLDNYALPSPTSLPITGQFRVKRTN